MALNCVYTVVNGVMLKETRNGVETEYVPDTNGNLWMTRDMSGNVTSTTDYWPYGEVQTSTGTNPSPLGFGGIVGYVTDTLTQLYVRARSYRADRARWLTVDLLWPEQSAYEYAQGSPTLFVDPEGMAPAIVSPDLVGNIQIGSKSSYGQLRLALPAGTKHITGPCDDEQKAECFVLCVALTNRDQACYYKSCQTYGAVAICYCRCIRSGCYTA